MSGRRIDTGLATPLGAPSVPPWLIRTGRVSCLIAAPVMAAFVIRELLAGKLGGAAVDLSRASPSWLGIAIACEVVSYLLYAAAQRHLVRRSARAPRIRWLASLAVCAQGVNNFVPAGYVVANLLNFRELRRGGLSPRSSAGLLLSSSALYIGALALLTLIAGEVAGAQTSGSLAGARVGALGVLAVLPAVALAARVLLRRGVIRWPEAWRPSGERLHLSGPAALIAGALFTSSWLADAGCLVAAVHAVGADPAWSLLPLAYCAAQLVSFLPLTPGGFGLVEGSLTVTLAGGGASLVLAAVLLYRLISYWGTLPFGVLGYLTVRRARQAGSITVDGDGQSASTLGDRAPGGDRSLLVLEG